MQAADHRTNRPFVLSLSKDGRFPHDRAYRKAWVCLNRFMHRKTHASTRLT